jgi:hypothetical protein
MEAVKVMGTIDERGQLTLDQPLELVDLTPLNADYLSKNLLAKEVCQWFSL